MRKYELVWMPDEIDLIEKGNTEDHRCAGWCQEIPWWKLVTSSSWPWVMEPETRALRPGVDPERVLQKKKKKKNNNRRKEKPTMVQSSYAECQGPDHL